MKDILSTFRSELAEIKEADGWKEPGVRCKVVYPGYTEWFLLKDQLQGDGPAEVETVNFNTSPGIIEKYQLLEDIHWSVRPLLITISLFTAIKLGSFIGKEITGSKGRRDSRGKDNQGERQLPMDAQSGNNLGWLPPQVANMLFGEGVFGTAAAP
ncbi:hypothetical protein MLD38_007091 [Melastoma candidum]|uniref:Uncharacterized protein n=1 Tax=Melastoma candidum TaxID=119954 RepID=A0ACB9RRX2_9MYRT|nr:hypothetical protein MLD38_007091 [Melastoma candidum]